MRSVRSSSSSALVRHGRRVSLRTLQPSDYDQWIEIRERCRDWLVVWEPRPQNAPFPAEDRHSFSARCSLRERERQLGTGFGFGIFVGTQLVGELTLSSVQRGPFQSAFIGYWVDQAAAGNGYVPEAVVVALAFAFEELDLHRIVATCDVRNVGSFGVMEKLGMRREGHFRRDREFKGEWRDTFLYAVLAEEWSSGQAGA